MNELAAAATEAAAMEAAAAAVEQEVQLLDEIEVEWKRRALDGSPEAVDRVLAIQKQRMMLRRLWPLPGGVRVSAGAATRGDEKEVRVVVEYVDDWRQAGRRSADQGG